MRMKKTIVVFKSTSFWDLPTKASEFMAFWQSKLDEIPNAYRDTAEIEVEAEPSYEDSAVLSVRVTYSRPETDDEVSSRERQENAAKERQREREMAQLRELRKKYPGA